MKIIKYITIALGGLIALLLLIALFLPNTAVVEQRITVTAPAQEVFQPIAKLRTWPEWTAWNAETLPGVEYTYGGPEQGAGSSMTWDSPQTVGTLTVQDYQPGKRMSYSINMEEGMGTSEGYFELSEVDGKTEVVWHDETQMHGIPLVQRYMLAMLKGMMTDAMGEGLQGLKARVEGGGTQ